MRMTILLYYKGNDFMMTTIMEMLVLHVCTLHIVQIECVYNVQCMYIILHNAHSQEGNLLKTTGSVGTGAPLEVFNAKYSGRKILRRVKNILGEKYKKG